MIIFKEDLDTRLDYMFIEMMCSNPTREEAMACVAEIKRLREADEKEKGCSDTEEGVF